MVLRAAALTALLCALLTAPAAVAAAAPSPVASPLPPDIEAGLAAVFGKRPDPGQHVQAQPRPEPDPPLSGGRAAPPWKASPPKQSANVVLYIDEGPTSSSSGGSDATGAQPQPGSSKNEAATSRPAASESATAVESSASKPKLAVESTSVSGNSSKPQPPPPQTPSASNRPQVQSGSDSAHGPGAVLILNGPEPLPSRESTRSSAPGRSESDLPAEPTPNGARGTTTTPNPAATRQALEPTPVTPTSKSEKTVIQVTLSLAPHLENLNWTNVDFSFRAMFAGAAKTTAMEWRPVAFNTAVPRVVIYQVDVEAARAAQVARDIAAIVRGGALGALAGITVTMPREPEIGVPKQEPVVPPKKVPDESADVDEEGEVDNARIESNGADGEKRGTRDVVMALTGAGGAVGIVMLVAIAAAALLVVRRRRKKIELEALESRANSSYGEDGYDPDDIRRTTATRLTDGGRPDGRADAIRIQSRTADWVSRRDSDMFSSAEIVPV